VTDSITNDPVAAATELAPQIRAAREYIQSECAFPSRLVEGMAQGNLFQLYVPKSIGGPETDPITAFRAVEELSKAERPGQTAGRQPNLACRSSH